MTVIPRFWLTLHQVACVTALLAALSGCGRDRAGSGQPAAAVPVTVQTVQPVSWQDSLQALGTAHARESVALTASVNEIVDQVHFDSGDEVRAGQVLVTLRGAAQQAWLAETEAAYAEAERLYQRQRELAQRQLVAQATLDAQKAQRDGLAARLQRMRSDLRDRSVRAPFDGVLGIRQVSPGTLVTASTVIATLDDIALIHVDFPVPEAELASVRPGDEISARTAAHPGREFSGTVSVVDARVDAATRAVTVRADFDNTDRALRPGMLLDVRLYRPARLALTLPEIAVAQVGRQAYVYRVAADDTVERVDVRPGARRDGKVEIVEGIAAGDRVVVDGTGKLRPGLKVKDASAASVSAMGLE